MGVLKELFDMVRYIPNWDDYKRHKTLELQYPGYRRKRGSQRRWEDLRLGETTTSVLSLLGLPDTFREAPDKENKRWDVRWWYHRFDNVNGSVVFNEGEVTGFGYHLADGTSVYEGIPTPCHNQEEGWSKLKLGMSELEAVKLVGGPDRIGVLTTDLTSVDPLSAETTLQPFDSLGLIWRYGDKWKDDFDAAVAFKNDEVVGIYCDRDGQGFRAVGTFQDFRKGQPSWEDLKLGMSEKDVLSMIGLPLRIEVGDCDWEDYDIIWSYGTDEIVFTNKKVVGFRYLSWDGGDVKRVEEGVLAEGEKSEASQPTPKRHRGTRKVSLQYSYVGSKTGRVFHIPSKGCSRNIEPGHLVGFSSRKAAVRRGYKPCLRCRS